VKRLPRGELEARIMDVLWNSEGWMTPGDVHAAITTARRPLAYTTVTTILVRLWQKGMLERQPAGRAFEYHPVSSRDEWAAERMQDLLERSGDRLQTLHHFAESISAKEATQLRRLLDQRKKR
jgi:predicted transcriptional regulator